MAHIGLPNFPLVFLSFGMLPSVCVCEWAPGNNIEKKIELAPHLYNFADKLEQKCINNHEWMESCLNTFTLSIRGRMLDCREEIPQTISDFYFSKVSEKGLS